MSPAILVIFTNANLFNINLFKPQSNLRKLLLQIRKTLCWEADTVPVRGMVVEGEFFP